MITLQGLFSHTWIWHFDWLHVFFFPTSFGFSVVITIFETVGVRVISKLTPTPVTLQAQKGEFGLKYPGKSPLEITLTTASQAKYNHMRVWYSIIKLILFYIYAKILAEMFAICFNSNNDYLLRSMWYWVRLLWLCYWATSLLYVEILR